MRSLTRGEIQELAGRSGVRRVAVENFLGTMDTTDVHAALANLRQDAHDYRWNSATQDAISAGIWLAQQRTCKMKDGHRQGRLNAAIAGEKSEAVNRGN